MRHRWVDKKVDRLGSRMLRDSGYFLTVVLPWFLKVVVPMAGSG
jgi:hypothetical protein